MDFLLAQLTTDVTGATKTVAADVATQSQTQFFNTLQSLANILWKVPASLVIIGAFYILGKIIAGRIINALQQARGDTVYPDMIVFVNRFSVVAMVSIGIALVLQFIFNVDFIQVVGFFALGISFAFKDLLENLIAGAVIIIQNTLRIGDFIQLGVGGIKGKVKEIQTRQTIIKGIDGSAIIVPNSKLMTTTIISFTLHNTRRLEFLLGLDLDADLNKAIKIIYEVIAHKDHVLKTPPPQVLIKGMSLNVNLGIRFWIDPHNKSKSWLFTRSELYAEIKAALDKEGIAVTYPAYVYYDNNRVVPKDYVGKEVNHPVNHMPQKILKRASHAVIKTGGANVTSPTNPTNPTILQSPQAPEIPLPVAIPPIAGPSPEPIQP